MDEEEKKASWPYWGYSRLNTNDSSWLKPFLVGLVIIGFTAFCAFIL